MGTGVQQRQLPLTDGTPYVGLRPFEAHESDRFFGREQDASLLFDKVLSGRLTLFYAQSGVGKSSLLRAMIIPRLVEADVRVIYFDAWAQQDPLAALKDVLILAATAAGVADAGRGSPTLTELARILCVSGNASLVLVLDQFEEFLVHHGRALDPLRSELAALMRATRLDVSVVLSLREEFLAALEPLRSQILNLFQSTYRLDGLPKDGLTRAIALPAELFGGVCEPVLVDALIADLRCDPDPGTAGEQREFVELPMLQLVCQELWRHADQRRLTLDLYQRLGGARQILDDYVRGLMPKRWHDQLFTARLLLHLAPASGLKTSYTLADLHEITGLVEPAIHAEVTRLSHARILRTREYRNAEQYELQHDAFIPVLHAWRIKVVERERRRRWAARFAIAAGCLLAFAASVVGFLYWRHSQELLLASEKQSRARAEQNQAEAQDRLNLQNALMLEQRKSAELERTRAKEREHLLERLHNESEGKRAQLEQWQTGGMLADLREMAAAERQKLAGGRFDLVAYYVLWRTQGGDRFEKLREVLMKNADLIPRSYVAERAPEIPMGNDWPLTLEYPEDREMNEAGFNSMWRDVRDWVVEQNGIPMPIQVRTKAASDLKGTQMRIAATGRKPESMTMPRHDSLFMVKTPAEALPDSPAKEFLVRFSEDWTRHSPRSWVNYRTVPAWALPVWKLAGQTAFDSSGMAAYELALQLLDNPRLLFSKPAVDALLAHAAVSYPRTVDEVRAALGDDLGNQLSLRVASDRSALMALPSVLNALTEASSRRDPAETSAAASDDAGGSGGSLTAVQQLLNKSTDPRAARDRLRGPWPKVPGFAVPAGGTEEQLQRAYLDIPTLLPFFQPIRVFVSVNLAGELFPRNAMPAALTEAINSMRAEFKEKYGFEPPHIRFRGTTPEDMMQPDTINVVVAGAPSTAGVNTIRTLKGPDKLGSLVAELRNMYTRATSVWITPEVADQVVRELQPNTRAWVESHYSLTDVTRLLRGIAGSSGETANGIGHSSWLLTALIPAATADDSTDAAALGRNLVRTARAFGNRTGANKGHSPAWLQVNETARALVRDDVAAATEAFRVALNVDRSAAPGEFQELWPTLAPAMWAEAIKRRKPNLSSVFWLLPSEWRELSEMETLAKSLGDRKTAWELDIYRQAGQERLKPLADRRPRLFSALQSAPKADDVSPAIAEWLAANFIKQYDPVDPRAGGPELYTAAVQMAERAIRGSDNATGLRLFSDISNNFPQNGTPTWAWQLLDELRLVRPDSPKDSMVLYLAVRLSGEESPIRSRQSLSLIDEHARLLNRSTDSTESLEIVDYVRARASHSLRMQGQVGFDPAEPYYRKLMNSKNEALRERAYLELAQVLQEEQRSNEARAIYVEGMKLWPDHPNFVAMSLTDSLHQVNRNELIAIYQRAIPNVKTSHKEFKADWMYTAALAAILTDNPGWQQTFQAETKLDQQYRDYILLLAYGIEGRRPGSPVRPWLEERARSIDQDKWPARLKYGDMGVWREMLVLRSLGRFSTDSAIAAVESDDAWAKSPLSQLPSSRRGFACEAYFYEAIISGAEGRSDRMKEYLRRSVETNFRSYYEHAMAAYLLAQR